ncbi:MAG: hypothetical protein JGK37_30255 [Microcoleus sp. PH2017_06_SFM_O_A]|nr:hypothetical protein [Microcoleus sp. PH2017_06_SFM_O_A]
MSNIVDAGGEDLYEVIAKHGVSRFVGAGWWDNCSVFVLVFCGNWRSGFVELAIGRSSGEQI